MNIDIYALNIETEHSDDGNKDIWINQDDQKVLVNVLQVDLLISLLNKAKKELSE